LALLPELVRHRRILFQALHTLVVFDGSHGTHEEVAEAIANGCRIVPVALTDDGSAAKLLANPNVRSQFNETELEKLSGRNIEAIAGIISDGFSK
jgi:predicted Rossmann-fold nucleotide-binding protein